ncbi:glycosyltransferase [Clostridium butyricum]
MNSLISIIVPVYNIEKYISVCVESILNQTIKNIEIILVDDGSSDSSGNICDRYSMLDNRIKVIHQKNKGLSGARNSGIDIAQGKYIGFVDGDDFIYPDMFECLYNLLEKNNADCACCGYDYFDEIKNKVRKINRNNKIYYMNDVEAIENVFFSQYYEFYAWNKLWKTNKFNKIRYPEGRIFEDISTTYELFKQCKNVIYIQSSKYVYRVRTGSITNQKANAKDLQLIESINYVIEDIKCNYKKQYKNSIVGYIGYYLGFINKIYNKQVIENEEKYISYLKYTIIKNIHKIVINKEISVIKKIQYLLFAINKKVYMFIYKKIKC